MRWSLMLMIVSATAMLASGCGRGEPAGETGVLNVFMWSDYIDPDIQRQFERVHGAPVRIDVYEQSETMLAKMQTQGGDRLYDLLVASDYTILELAELGLIQEIDRSRVENLGNIAERFRNPAYDPDDKWSVPYQWGTTGIMYRKDRFAGVEDFTPSWALFFDRQYREQLGHPPFVLVDDVRDCFAAALKYLGYSVNTTDPDEIRAAADVILQAKQSPGFVGFEGGGQASASRVASGQAALAIVYSGDAFKAMEETEGLDYTVPRQGATVWVDAMVIPARTGDLELAYAFINYILDAQIGGQLSDFNRYATPNQAALQYVAPEDRADPDLYPPDDVMQHLEMIDAVGDATQLYDEAWAAIKAR